MQRCSFAWGNHGELPQWLSALVENPFALDKIKTAAQSIRYIWQNLLD